MREIKTIMREKINSVANKTTFISRMKDNRLPEHLSIDKKKKDDRSTSVNEPKSNKKINPKPPRNSKLEINNPRNKNSNNKDQNNKEPNGKFIDRKKIKNENSQGKDKKDQSISNKLKSITNKGNDVEQSESENSVVNDIQGLNINKNEHDAENQNLILE